MKTIMFFAWMVVVVAYLYAGYAVAAVIHSHGSTNSLGVVTYQENPNSYLLASVKLVNVEERDHKIFTEIEYNPYGTYSEFKEYITFCGDQFELFSRKTTNSLAFTFKRKQSQAYCYDLVGVDELKPRHLPWESE